MKGFATPHSTPPTYLQLSGGKNNDTKMNRKGYSVNHKSEKPVSTPQRKSSTPSTCAGSSARHVLTPCQSPTKKPTSLDSSGKKSGLLSGTKSGSVGKAEYSMDGRVRSKSAGSEVATQRGSRAAILSKPCLSSI